MFATRALLRSASIATRPATVTLPGKTRAFTRSAVSSKDVNEHPLGQVPPATSPKVKSQRTIAVIGGVGLAIGAVFFFLTGKPDKAAAVATGQSGRTADGTETLKKPGAPGRTSADTVKEMVTEKSDKTAGERGTRSYRSE